MRHRRRLFAALLGAALASPSLHGCMRGCESSRPPILINPSMVNQPKALPYAASHFFFDGKAMRDPVPGTIARGHLPAAAGPGAGVPADAVEDLEGTLRGSILTALDERQAQLVRGRERYGIYCTPCHDERGEGRGILTERGKVPTRNLLEKRMRELSDAQLLQTITDGTGLMPGYRYPISASDRRAIVVYVRSLQDAAARLEAEP
jgi:hypothetical protein